MMTSCAAQDVQYFVHHTLGRLGVNGESGLLPGSADGGAVKMASNIRHLDEDTEIEEAWAAEVERRMEGVDTGSVQLIPAADAITHGMSAFKAAFPPRRPASAT